MGTCFTSCLPQSEATKALRNFHFLDNQNSGVEFRFLVEDNVSSSEETKRSYTSRDIQLQCLDARALLQRTATSTPASSLDLEWEHETLPISMVHDPSGSSWTAIPEDFSHGPSNSSQRNTTPAPNSDTDWSRVSSANSLEWDTVPNSIHDSPPISEIDTDTQFLLCEIERLTNKTLEETGQDLFS